MKQTAAKKQKLRKIKCPKCKHESTCELANRDFLVIQTLEAFRPLCIIEGYVIADEDGELIEGTSKRPKVSCCTCGHVFRLPNWALAVTIADRLSMKYEQSGIIRVAKGQEERILKARKKRVRGKKQKKS